MFYKSLLNEEIYAKTLILDFFYIFGMIVSKIISEFRFQNNNFEIKKFKIDILDCFKFHLNQLRLNI